MALSFTTRGTGGNNTTGTSTSISPTANLTGGTLGVLSIALDNAGSAGSTAAAPAGPITDSRGNVWLRRMDGIFDNGAASAGVEIAIYTSSLLGGGMLTTDTLVLNWIAGVSVVAKAWTIQECAAASGKSAVFLSQAAGTGVSAGTSAPVTTGTITSGDAVVGVAGLEGADSWAGDADTSNGNWATQQHTGFGTGTTGMSVTSQTKVTTGTATQTYNPTCTAGDCIGGWISITEVSNPFFKRESYSDVRDDIGSRFQVPCNSWIVVNLLLTLLAPAAPSTTDIFPPPLYAPRIVAKQVQDTAFVNLLENTLKPAASIPSSGPPDSPVFRPIVQQPDPPQDLLSTTLAPQIPIGKALEQSRPQWIPPQPAFQPLNLLQTTLAQEYVFNEAQQTRRIAPIQTQVFELPNLLENTLKPSLVSLPTGQSLESRPQWISPQPAFQPLNLLETVLAPQIPVASQLDARPQWIPPQPAFQPLNLLETTLAAQIPVGQKVESHPRWIAPQPADQPVNLLENTLASVTPPDITNIFRDLQITKIVIPIRTQDQIVPNLLTSTLFAPPVQPPFKQTEWPQPIRVRATPLFDPPNTIALVSQPNIKPFKQTEWPNPIIPSRFRDTDSAANLLGTVLGSVQYVPRIALTSSQAARPRLVQQPFDFPNTIQLITPAGTKPFHQDDWPNPVVVRRNPQADHVNTTSLVSTPNIKPFKQTEWPNPVLASRFREADNPPSLLQTTLSTVTYIPRIALTSSQANWRVPARPPFEFPNTIPLLTLPRPFFQTDWPNPVLRQYTAPVDVPFNTTRLVTTPNPKPNHNDDWPNPVLRVYAAPVSVMSNMIVLGFPAPPKGHHHKKHFIGEIQSLGVQEESVILDSSMGIT